MNQNREPNGDSADFFRGLVNALPISIAVWCLIIVIGAGLGYVVNLITDNLMTAVHAKLVLAVVMIFVGLFTLERILRPPTRKP